MNAEQRRISLIARNLLATLEEIGHSNDQTIVNGMVAAKALVDNAETLRTKSPSTWTFIGHWDGGLVIEYSVPGEIQDDREDDGTYPEGLWAAAGSGETIEEAEANARSEYENEDDEAEAVEPSRQWVGDIETVVARANGEDAGAADLAVGDVFQEYGDLGWMKVVGPDTGENDNVILRVVEAPDPEDNA